MAVEVTTLAVPRTVIESLALYVLRGIRPGSFLCSVLDNDLKGACARADCINRHKLWDIVSLLYNYAPRECWGHEGAVDDWIRERKAHGILDRGRLADFWGRVPTDDGI